MSKVLPRHTPKNTSLVKIKRKNRKALSSTTNTLLTNITFSTSAIANVRSLRNSNTENTLSMISTPWSTDYNSYASIASHKGAVRSYPSSASLMPISSSTVRASSPENLSVKTTITLYNVPSVPTEQDSAFRFPKLKLTRIRSSDTLSSWTIETFTSNGLSSVSGKVKPKYPWSPSSVFSGTDIYPTTVETLVSRKGSRESSRVFGSVASRYDMAPMNLKENKSEDDFILDSILIKTKGIPIWH
ncbi:uncharacterized protein LOC128676990 [Plodia interpunctella]|uniref:uncharacterized protein LOC128676990 n=1 Tax=Plodia interpunctella TaxID=58824 RepID=UPI002367E69E|nr:uncharacterized protein LOC128676990 [Plodia interpunctella]